MIVGAVTGLGLALVRLTGRRWLTIPAALYIDFFRTTPMLTQILWAYFVLPGLVGIDFGIFTASVIAIGLNTGAFLAEIYRAAIQAIPRGQWDAGRILGLRRRTIFTVIIGPQAAKIALPPFTAMTMVTLKGTSLAAILGVLELTRRGELVASATFQPLPVLTLIGIMYFVIVYPISVAAARMERRFRVSERLTARVPDTVSSAGSLESAA